MLIGVNSSQYSTVNPDIPGLTVVRRYSDNGYVWPASPQGVVSWITFNPNPAELTAGKLDTKIKSLVKGAPAGSMLGCYHEVNHFRTITPAQMIAVHEHMLPLVHEANPNVKYGAVLNDGSGLAQWVIPGLDYYAIDLYDWSKNAKTNPVPRLEASFNQLPSGPYAVSETNSPVVSYRPIWFATIYAWLLSKGGLAMSTYWNPTGQYSGAWISNDAATIRALKHVIAAAPSNSL